MSKREDEYSAPGAYAREREAGRTMEQGTVLVRHNGVDVVTAAARDERGYVSYVGPRGTTRATHDTRATFLPLVQRADVIRRIGTTTVRMSWDARGNITVRVTIGDSVATFPSVEDAAYAVAHVLTADGGESDFMVASIIARLFAGDDMDAALDAAHNGASDAVMNDVRYSDGLLASVAIMIAESR
jgi:hypothetical protein